MDVLYIPLHYHNVLRWIHKKNLKFFDTPSIVKYLEPLIEDLFTARFADCHFDETLFSTLDKNNVLPKQKSEFTWESMGLHGLDIRTNQYENEVKRIIHLQDIINQSNT